MNNFYLLTSFICGAIVMIIEIVGTKILSPFFGSGLFVWSSTITVTMLALSVGYFIGGKNADKIEDLSGHLYKLILIASVILLFTYDLAKVIYFFYDYLDIKVSTFLSSFILLFAPLTLLGMISPVILKLTAKEFKQIGKDLGFIYAVSTLGSLVGSLFAGFILLAYLGTKEIFFCCSLVLMLLSQIYFLSKKQYVFLLLAFIFIFFSPNSNRLGLEVKSDTIKKVAKTEGFYGTVLVVEKDLPNEPNFKPRVLLLDGMPQGAIDKVTNKGLVRYQYVIEELIGQIDKEKTYKNILFFGVGAGVMPTYLKDRYNLTLVDINPVVVDFAKKYFNLKADVIIEDARAFINKSKQKQDIIVIDVFSGETVPGHLLTQEFMAMMKAHSSKDAALIFNIVGNPYEGEASKAIINTISSEFSSVNVMPLKDKNLKTINYIVLASNKKIEVDKKNLVERISPRIQFNQDLVSTLTAESIDIITNMEIYKDGEIITDNFNRIDFLSIEERKEIRKGLAKSLLAAI